MSVQVGQQRAPRAAASATHPAPCPIPEPSRVPISSATQSKPVSGKSSPKCEADTQTHPPTLPLQDEESHVAQHAEHRWSKGCWDPVPPSAPERGRTDPQRQHPGPGPPLKLTGQCGCCFSERGGGDGLLSLRVAPTPPGGHPLYGASLRLKAVDLEARNVCLSFPVRTRGHLQAAGTQGQVRLRSHHKHLLWPCPHLELQLLSNLLYPPQRLF